MRLISPNRLLRFTAQLTPICSCDFAAEAAGQRDWLDQHGRLTAQGLHGLSALDEHAGTRRALR